MRLGEFIKDKLAYIAIDAACFGFLVFFMKESGMGHEYIKLIIVTMCITATLRLALEYNKKRKFYRMLFDTMETMPKKQYIGQVLEEPDFIEGVYLTEAIGELTKAMNDEIASYQIRQQDYQEYIEAWIHEVKLPIASISLLCDNAKSHEASQIKAQLKRIEGYVEQVLYYAKSTHVGQDYRVQQIALSRVVKDYLKTNAAELIGNHTEIKLGMLDFEIYTDPKWLIFILNQICTNSIKYRRNSLKLIFRAEEHDNTIVFHIEDNGIGMEKTDLPYVFEKGYTGSNGRMYGKSTGIGLYLCRKLCDKMHHGITITSVKGEGTTVSIAFPKDYYYLVEKENS